MSIFKFEKAEKNIFEFDSDFKKSVAGDLLWHQPPIYRFILESMAIYSRNMYTVLYKKLSTKIFQKPIRNRLLATASHAYKTRYQCISVHELAKGFYQLFNVDKVFHLDFILYFNFHLIFTNI